MEEQQLPINMVAILVAVVANFILGFLWYTPLFGKAWAKEMGFDMSVKPPAGSNGKGNDLYGHREFLSRLSSLRTTSRPGALCREWIRCRLPMQIFNSTVFTWLGFYLPVDLERRCMGKQIVEIIFHQHRVSFYDAVSGVGDHYVYAVDGGLKLDRRERIRAQR